MRLHYKGKYDLNPDSLPHGEHQPNAVPFKEAQDTATLGKYMTIVSIIVLAVFSVPLFIRCGNFVGSIWFLAGLAASVLAAFPHELLHAICFKEDAYIYTNIKQGMLFVIGPETMSKGRFIFMSLLPNMVFGFLPYTIAMIFPEQTFFASMGLVSIAAGCGDFYNVFNAATQMPRGARTYLYKFNSFWYMPE